MTTEPTETVIIEKQKIGEIYLSGSQTFFKVCKVNPLQAMEDEFKAMYPDDVLKSAGLL